MKAVAGATRAKQRRSTAAPGAAHPSKPGTRAVGLKPGAFKGKQAVAPRPLGRPKGGRPSKDLLHRVATIEKELVVMRKEVRSGLLARATAELRAVNAEQARAGLQQLHADLLEMARKGITGDDVDAPYSQTAEDVV